MRIGGRKTVDGRGRDITVDGTWRIQGVRDVIISDIGITRSIRNGEQQDGDAILIRGAGGDDAYDFETRHIWIHHCELFDGGDGLIDIRGGTDITISWSHFRDHKKVTLAWQDRNGDPAATRRAAVIRSEGVAVSTCGRRFQSGAPPGTLGTTEARSAEADPAGGR